MATVLVKNDMGRYARIDKKSSGITVVWVGQDGATHFESVDKAQEAIKEAVKNIRNKALVKTKKYEKEGGYPFIPKNWEERNKASAAFKGCSIEDAVGYIKKAVHVLNQKGDNIYEKDDARRELSHLLEKGGIRLGRSPSVPEATKLIENFEMLLEAAPEKMVQSIRSDSVTIRLVIENALVKVPVDEEFFAPQWVNDWKERSESIVYESVINSEDLTDKVQMFFIRSVEGWWRQDGKTVAYENLMHKAQVFYSLEAAQSMVSAHDKNPKSSEVLIIEGGFIMEKAHPFKQGFGKDQVSNALISACEVKQISSELQKVVDERKKAIEENKSVLEQEQEVGVAKSKRMRL